MDVSDESSDSTSISDESNEGGTRTLREKKGNVSIGYSRDDHDDNNNTSSGKEV
jgi:hypothetical protein